MNKYDLQEAAYKNGYEAGKNSVDSLGIEIATRVKVAYEQLGKCHTKLCRNSGDDGLCEDFREVLNKLLHIQVKLGALKKEADIK